MNTVLAIDLGASSGRAISATLNSGRIELKELHRFSNDPVRIGKTLYWDVLRLFYEIEQGIIKAHLGGGFDSVGIDTWGVDFALLDGRGDLLQNPVHYRDERTHGLTDQLSQIISDADLYGRTGIQKMQINTIYQLHALAKTRPELLKNAESALMIPDFLNYILTGKKSAEYSIASTSALASPVSRDWDRGLMEIVGLPDLFCAMREPGTILGDVKADIAEELCVPSFQVISIAGHDTACAVVAVPHEGGAQERFAYISSGTWSLMGTETSAPIFNEKAYAYNMTNEGGYGNTVRLLKNIMGLWLIQESRRQWQKEGQDYTFAQLVELAKKASPFKSFLNMDHESLLMPGNMPRRIYDLCKGEKPATVGETARCIFEGLAFKYRKTLLELQELTQDAYRTLHIVGGGANNELLNQFTANATGLRVVAGPTEATVLGNAAVQWLATGKIASLSEARAIIARSADLKTYAPQDTTAWQAAYAQYLSLFGSR